MPTSITLKVLHDVVQIVMGWFDAHLWEFTIAGRRYGLPMDDDWSTEPRMMAAKVRLRDVLNPRPRRPSTTSMTSAIMEARLTATDIRAGEAGASYPQFVAGEHNAPPEDCGGIPGFYAMLDAVADRHHPNRAQIKELLGDYDPDVIDTVPIGFALARIAKQKRRQIPTCREHA